MSTKYGPGHPDMVALNRQIEVARRRRSLIAAGRPTTNWAAIGIRLENELAAIAKQLEVLQSDIVTDETEGNADGRAPGGDRRSQGRQNAR